MGAFRDLAGQRFGRLTVIEKSHSEGRGKGWYWKCRCSCSDETLVVVQGVNLTQLVVRSCGCLQRERASETSKTHGMSATVEYATWQRILGRCYNENNPAYPDYGGRGIQVCERWRESFENFYADMGPRPEGDYCIERKEVNGNYCPENCIWELREEGNRNKRGSNWYTHNGIKMLIVDWAREFGVPSESLRYRLKSGMSMDEAVSKPFLEKKPTRTYRGEEKTLDDLQMIAGVPKKTIANRINRLGWSVEDAAETPVGEKPLSQQTGADTVTQPT